MGVDTGGTGFENCTTGTGCQIGGAGGAAGAVDNPFGVGVDADGKILVADFLKRRISRFSSQVTVTVTKALLPATDPGRFDLRVDGVVARASAGNGESGSLETLDGSVTIDEQAAAQPLSDYETSIDCGAGPQPGTSLTLTNVIADVNCTITNTRDASPTPPPTPPVTPDFEIVGAQLDRASGTATLTVEANTDGIVWIAKTNKVKRTESVSIELNELAELAVVPRNSAARTLERKGRLKVNPMVRFGPAAGGELGKRHQVTLRRD